MTVGAVKGALQGVPAVVETPADKVYSTGTPVEPSSASFKAELDLIVDGKAKAPKTPAIVRQHIEALMKKKGHEAADALKPQWKNQVEKALSAMPESIRDGARFAMTQKILEKIPAARK